jgi:hypothetical protein
VWLFRFLFGWHFYQLIVINQMIRLLRLFGFFDFCKIFDALNTQIHQNTEHNEWNIWARQHKKVLLNWLQDVAKLDVFSNQDAHTSVMYQVGSHNRTWDERSIFSRHSKGPTEYWLAPTATPSLFIYIIIIHNSKWQSDTVLKIAVFEDFKLR